MAKPATRKVELEPAMRAAVAVFDALESVAGPTNAEKRTRSLLIDALRDMNQAGIPVPLIDAYEPKENSQ